MSNRDDLVNKTIELGELFYKKIRDGEIDCDKALLMAKNIALQEEKLKEERNMTVPDEQQHLCPKCKKPYKEGVSFCSECGFNIKEFYDEKTDHCETCGSIVSSDSNYCPVCGFPVNREV